MTPVIVPATEAMVPAFADNARAADVAECWALGRVLPGQAMLSGVRTGRAWAGFVDDEPVCLFGVRTTSLLGREGVPWMLGTDAVERYQVPFLRQCRPIVAGWRSEYDSLVNWVDERNTVAQRWLRWLGFTLDAPAPFGVEGLPFRRFEWRKG